MNSRPTPPSNPFSTRFIRPGAATYRFPDGTSAESLAHQFVHQFNGQASIIGPHGSGKTSLLYALAPYLGVLREAHLCDGDPTPAMSPIREATHSKPRAEIFWFRLMQRSEQGKGSRQLTQHHSRCNTRKLVTSSPLWNRESLVIIDGWEQLRWPMRGWIYWKAKRSKTQLLVTAHEKTIFPTLWEATVRIEIAQQVIQDLLVSQLLPSEQNNPPLIATFQNCDLLTERLLEHRGSLREVLFTLYDDFERTCRSDSQR